MPRKRVKAKYLETHRAECEALDVLALLDQTLQEAMGDDYDGCFTVQGQAEYDISVEVLKDKINKLQTGSKGIDI